MLATETAASPETASPETAAELLGRWVSDGDCLGGQLFAWRDGRVEVDAALGRTGDGGPASTEDVVRLYCAVKPITAVALLAAAEKGLLSLDDRVGSHLPGYAELDRHGVTLRKLLSHTSGLMDHGFDLNRRPYGEVASILGRYTFPAASWYHEPSYNDSTSWCILAAVVEKAYQEPLATVARRVVTGPVGLDGLTLTGPDPSRFVAYHSVREGRFTSLENSDGHLAVVNPAHGGFSSAGQLGRFYAELVRCATGSGRILSQSSILAAVQPIGIVDFGAGLGRKPYGLGFVCDVRQDAVGGEWSLRSFGHAGFIGQYKTILGFGDLSHRTAVAVSLYSVGAKNTWRLRALTRALADELGIGGGDHDG
jgi:CubicO group peptidase (beta-lactamase class C family)